MKRLIIRADINTYSYTGSAFWDDEITLAYYTTKAGDIEITLQKDGFSCYVEVIDNYDVVYHKTYKMRDIERALDDFNLQVRLFCHTRWECRLSDIEMVLNEYDASIDDYMPGGFYDTIRR